MLCAWGLLAPALSGQDTVIRLDQDPTLASKLASVTEVLPHRAVLSATSPSLGTRTRFVDLAGGFGAMIRIVPAQRHPGKDAIEAALAPWREMGCTDVEMLPERGAATGEHLQQCRGLWFDFESFPVDRPEVPAHFLVLSSQLYDREPADLPVVGASGRAADWIGARRTEAGSATAGMGLIPGLVVGSTPGEVLDQLIQWPDCVGLRLSKGAVEIVGRRATPIGPVGVTFHLPASCGAKQTLIEVPASTAVDFVRLRRAAIGSAKVREGESGHPSGVPAGLARESGLVVLGGSRLDELPDAAVRAFVAAAGGPDARIGIATLAEPSTEHLEMALARLRECGPASVDAWPASGTGPLDEAAIVAAADRFTGLWFIGDRSWRVLDRLPGDLGARLCNRFAMLGHAVGGSSTVISTLGSTMLRGDPLNDHVVLADGYENGIGFLPGQAFDPHCASRELTAGLSAIARARPGEVIVGLDDATALLLRGDTYEVVGPGAAHLVRTLPAKDGGAPREQKFELRKDTGAFDFIKWAPR